MTEAITVISFDADGTLFDFAKVMRQSLGHALAELRLSVPGIPDTLTVEAMIAIRNQVGEELKGAGMKLEALRFAAFQQTLHHIGVADPNDDMATHLHNTYLKHRFEDVDLFGDVIPILDALQGRFKLGIITNGNSDPERCGLEGKFQFVILAQDHGVEKPDLKIFEIAVQEAGISSNHFLHVGDSLENDVLGANQAGMLSVWLNRDGRANDTGIQPDHEISALTELNAILDG